MQKGEILRLIKETIAKTIPSGAKVILFGSQARGDAKEDSDWDILILLNKDKVELDDHDYISYPFFELGWNIDVQIHPILYTFKDWMERSISTRIRFVSVRIFLTRFAGRKNGRNISVVSAARRIHCVHCVRHRITPTH